MPAVDDRSGNALAAAFFTAPLSILAWAVVIYGLKYAYAVVELGRVK